LVLADALLAESGRSLLHHLVTDFDAKPTFAGDAPLYRFCPRPCENASEVWVDALRFPGARADADRPAGASSLSEAIRL